jgi:hypothetical protein
MHCMHRPAAALAVVGKSSSCVSIISHCVPASITEPAVAAAPADDATPQHNPQQPQQDSKALQPDSSRPPGQLTSSSAVELPPSAGRYIISEGKVRYNVDTADIAGLNSHAETAECCLQQQASALLHSCTEHAAPKPGLRHLNMLCSYMIFWPLNTSCRGHMASAARSACCSCAAAAAPAALCHCRTVSRQPVGIANTVRRYQESRPLRPHLTPFEARLEAKIAEEVVAAAALQAGGAAGSTKKQLFDAQ